MAQHKISSTKVEAVKRIAQVLKGAKCIMIVSIKSLPAAQFQKMKKELRGKADLEVAKKTILLRAMDASGIEGLEALKENVKEDSALLVSKDDGFELSAWFTENTSPIFAKEGQIAEDDIQVEEGPTELVPGPVISELGALGLQIMVEDGKIKIRKSKVAIKKGEKVNSSAASIFQKLGIKPFKVGIIPIAFFDVAAKKVYVGVKINKREQIDSLLIGYSRALGFATNIAYPTTQTIGMLLGKANAQANALNKFASSTQ